MKTRYRLYPRGKVWYCEDSITRKQESLRTKDKAHALQLLNLKNQPHLFAGFHLQMARAHLQVGDAESIQRTWQNVMDAVTRSKVGKTKLRWERASKDKAFDAIRNSPVVETKADAFLAVMAGGTVSTNVFLRRLHNYALDMNWLLSPVVPKRQWPKVQYGEKRAITHDEHKRIIEREINSERKLFYEVCWHVGGGQSDMANLKAENIDWNNRTLTYFRMKNGKKSQMVIGAKLEQVLRLLPQTGPLFPYLATVRECDRATEFKQRCKGLGIAGVTLHSYRYAWAERGKAAGYPERFAQEALGHNSKAVHRAYASRAEVKLPSLEGYEDKIVQLNLQAAAA